MVEKHKSKYKKPENAKPVHRKDIKDYTLDDKDEKLNPYSTGEKQKNVLRKTDKEFVDTGDMYVKYNADDRLYKDVEEGEYDPKHAAKVLKKRQDADEKLSKNQLKDKIENLTREGKEKFVRTYIQAKIKSYLKEQAEAPAPEEDPLAGLEGAPEVAPDPLTAAAAPIDTPAPAPVVNNEPKESLAAELGNSIRDKNEFEQVGAILSAMESTLKDSDIERQRRFYAEFYPQFLKQRAKIELVSKLKP